MKDTKNGASAVKMAVIGAGLAGLAATSYFFLGPKGKAHQKHAKAWIIKMKGDVIEKLETARDVSESAYHNIIDSVATEYEKGMKASRDEISEVAKDLKKHWKTLSGQGKTAKKAVVKTTKEIVKKVTSK